MEELKKGDERRKDFGQCFSELHPCFVEFENHRPRVWVFLEINF